jgi:hypothetical protein
MLDQVSLLLRGEAERAHSIVVGHHVGERRRAAVVKVGRVLPECAQRRGAITAVQIRRDPAGGPRHLLGFGTRTDPSRDEGARSCSGSRSASAMVCTTGESCSVASSSASRTASTSWLVRAPHSAARVWSFSRTSGRRSLRGARGCSLAHRLVSVRRPPAALLSSRMRSTTPGAVRHYIRHGFVPDPPARVGRDAAMACS